MLIRMVHSKFKYSSLWFCHKFLFSLCSSWCFLVWLIYGVILLLQSGPYLVNVEKGFFIFRNIANTGGRSSSLLERPHVKTLWQALRPSLWSGPPLRQCVAPPRAEQLCRLHHDEQRRNWGAARLPLGPHVCHPGHEPVLGSDQ